VIVSESESFLARPSLSPAGDKPVAALRNCLATKLTGHFLPQDLPEDRDAAIHVPLLFVHQGSTVPHKHF
jgi:hypothetical protein